jgi:iron complex outermembrane receptor protein
MGSVFHQERPMSRTAIPLLLALTMLCPATADAQEPTVVTGVITTRDDGLPLPGATVSIPTLKMSAVTNSEGRYRMAIPGPQAKGQVVELLVIFAGLQPTSLRVTLAPGTVTQDLALALSFSEMMTVGSRVIGAAAEKAVPVDILTSQQIEATGATQTMEVIQALAPSFNFPRPTVSDGTDSVRPATLRGLGPDQVLVLINGKRRHQTALIHINSTIGRGSTGVDLNAIPVSAIERIEILRDGAAAQYGSDAIAGVINLVLKSGANPVTLSFKAGGNKGVFSEVNGTERDFSDGGTLDASGSGGWTIGRASVSFAGEVRDRKGTNRAGYDSRDQLVAGDAGNNSVAQPNTHWGEAKTRDVLFFANAELPLSDAKTASLYAFGGWSRRTGQHGGNFRRAIDATNWRTMYPQGFLPLIEPTNIDASGTLGVRGVRSGWFWDASGQYGHNRLDYNVTHSLNVSLGPIFPPNKTEFYSGALVFNQFVGNVDLSRPFAVGLASPLNVAFGLQWLRENYRIIAGERDSYDFFGSLNQFGTAAGTPGAQVFPGFRPSNEVDASRSNVAAYVDVETDVTGLLRVGVAGRYEHYSDFGSTADGKLTVRVQPDRRFVVRGAISTGFRAPSLGQSYFSTISTNFLFDAATGQFLPSEVATFPVGSAEARALGATALTPEQSMHFSGGLVVTPVAGLDVTADLYRVDIDDRIVFSDNFTGPSIVAFLRPFGAATSARFFTNAIDTETKGLDLTVNYLKTLATGTVRLTAGYNHTSTAVVRILPTPPQLVGLENTLFSSVPPNDIEKRRYECAQPQDSLRLSADWQWRRFGVVARESQFGEYCSLEAVNQIFEAEWVTDLEMNYRLPKAVLGFGVQNLTNTFPDKLLPVPAFNNIRTYPRNSPFGFNGRYFYAKLTVTF